MGLTFWWDSARYKLYTSCTAEAKKHDGVREKLRGLDYKDQRSKRRVVHSVPYLTIRRANRIPKPDFRKAWEKARSRSGSQYNNFNSFNGLSSDSLCCIIPYYWEYHWDGLDTQYTVYCIFFCIFFVILTTLLFHAQEIEFNRLTVSQIQTTKIWRLNDQHDVSDTITNMVPCLHGTLAVRRRIAHTRGSLVSRNFVDTRLNAG
jgi:hypothetical protein